MPLIVTPGQLTQRAEFYHQLAQLTSAGIGLPRALEQLQRHSTARSFRGPIKNLLRHITAGYTFAESLQQTGGWMPAFDIALIQAGEQSGRLPDCLQQISDHYRDRAQLLRTTLLVLVYPMFVLHFAILIFPINRLTGLVLHGETLPFLLQKMLVLGPLYAVVVVGVIAAQGKAAGWRAFIERLLRFVPVLGRARRSLAIARLSSALEALINAGVNMIEGWELAAAASASPALLRVVRAAKPQLAAGTTPAEMIFASTEFPAEFAQMYSTGEISGKLDESLKRARVFFQEEGSRKLKQFVFGSTGVLIFAIMLLVAWQIISFYLGYFRQIQDAVGP
jgi:type II secretory pathway component PulF